MMTACDLGAVTKPWDISRKVRSGMASQVRRRESFTHFPFVISGGRVGDQRVLRAGRPGEIGAEADALRECLAPSFQLRFAQSPRCLRRVSVFLTCSSAR